MLVPTDEAEATLEAIRDFDGVDGAELGESTDDWTQIDVTIVKSAEPPTGVGEPGVPPVGPAVANAWRVLTGKPVRQLPFATEVT